jgi:hypothetical protein
MTEEPHTWQPGERALYVRPVTGESYRVTIVRRSRARSGSHCWQVKWVNGRRLTIHEQYLKPIPEDPADAVPR